MYTRSDNEEFMNGDDTNEIIKLLFESFLQRFEENLQEKMRGSDFEFDCINFFYYNFNKTRWIIHRFSKMVKGYKINHKS